MAPPRQQQQSGSVSKLPPELLRQILVHLSHHDLPPPPEDKVVPTDERLGSPGILAYLQHAWRGTETERPFMCPIYNVWDVRDGLEIRQNMFAFGGCCREWRAALGSYREHLLQVDIAGRLKDMSVDAASGQPPSLGKVTHLYASGNEAIRDEKDRKKYRREPVLPPPSVKVFVQWTSSLLAHLTLDQTTIDFLEPFAALLRHPYRQLRGLQVVADTDWGVVAVTKQFYTTLAKLQGLREIDINASKMSLNGIRALRAISRLEELEIITLLSAWREPVVAPTRPATLRSKRLRHVDVYDIVGLVLDDAFDMLSSCRSSLEYLRLEGNAKGDQTEDPVFPNNPVAQQGPQERSPAITFANGEAAAYPKLGYLEIVGRLEIGLWNHNASIATAIEGSPALEALALRYLSISECRPGTFLEWEEMPPLSSRSTDAINRLKKRIGSGKLRMFLLEDHPDCLAPTLLDLFSQPPPEWEAAGVQAYCRIIEFRTDSSFGSDDSEVEE